MSEFVELGKVVESLTESVRSTTVANYVMAKAIKVIATLPTTEIIRCKDCKHSVPDIVSDKIEGYECDLCYDSYWDADDFCSRGELK